MHARPSPCYAPSMFGQNYRSNSIHPTTQTVQTLQVPLPLWQNPTHHKTSASSVVQLNNAGVNTSLPIRTPIKTHSTPPPHFQNAASGFTQSRRSNCTLLRSTDHRWQQDRQHCQATLAVTLQQMQAATSHKLCSVRWFWPKQTTGSSKARPASKPRTDLRYGIITKFHE